MYDISLYARVRSLSIRVGGTTTGETEIVENQFWFRENSPKYGFLELWCT